MHPALVRDYSKTVIGLIIIGLLLFATGFAWMTTADVDTTFWTLRQFVSAENYREAAPSVRDEQPLALRRFLDMRGRVTGRPAKRRDQELVLEYLGSKFERGREYTEREVNEIINSWHTYRDHATIRRELYNARLLDRTPDGARYWRPEQPAVSSQELTLEDGR